MAPKQNQNGSGLFPTLFGSFIVLVLLLCATQIAMGLYQISMTQSLAFDAARRVAESSRQSDAIADAEAQLRRQLGTQFVAARWDDSNPSMISLSLTSRRTTLLPSQLMQQFESKTITRTANVRRETLHP
jgi:hypothetical protein